MLSLFFSQIQHLVSSNSNKNVLQLPRKQVYASTIQIRSLLQTPLAVQGMCETLADVAHAVGVAHAQEGLHLIEIQVDPSYYRAQM